MSRTLLPYQARWVADKAGLKVIEKSRRIGLSWAEAYDAVLHAGEGKGNVYYQSYNKDMTRGFIDDCAEWAETLDAGAAAVGETLIRDGARDVQAFRLELASGKEVLAMTSAPRAFRSKGRPGDVAVIDEAAFVDDLEEVLKAALAFRQWGGRVHVLSTHNGEASPFAALVRDIRERVRPGSLHTVTLKQAIAEGLYMRICQVTGQAWSRQSEAAWEAALRAGYGIHAAEELDCIPSAGAGAWLAWELIRAAEDAAAGAPDDFAGGPVHIGIDIARRRDLWVAAVIENRGRRALAARAGGPAQYYVCRAGRDRRRARSPLPALAHRRRPDRHGRGRRRALAGRARTAPCRRRVNDRSPQARCRHRAARSPGGPPSAHPAQ